jgi:hypothetical protein
MAATRALFLGCMAVSPAKNPDLQRTAILRPIIIGDSTKIFKILLPQWPQNHGTYRIAGNSRAILSSKPLHVAGPKRKKPH